MQDIAQSLEKIAREQRKRNDLEMQRNEILGKIKDSLQEIQKQS